MKTRRDTGLYEVEIVDPRMQSELRQAEIYLLRGYRLDHTSTLRLVEAMMNPLNLDDEED